MESESSIASQTPVDTDIDADRADSSDWPYRPLANLQGVRGGCFQAIFRQSAIDEIHLHGQSLPKVEVCGVLVGSGYRDDFGPYLLIEHSIQGTAATSQATNVTFTAETWTNIQTAMDTLYPELRMVGWYHTHPGFGIFLSDMDLFIHGNFFNLPWQVALVYDPVSGDEGNFIWRAGLARREAYLVEVDVTPQAARTPLIDKAEAIAGGASIEATAKLAESELKVDQLQARVKMLEQRTRWLMIVIAFMAAFIAMLSAELAPKPPAGPRPATTGRAEKIKQPTTRNQQPRISH